MLRECGRTDLHGRHHGSEHEPVPHHWTCPGTMEASGEMVQGLADVIAQCRVDDGAPVQLVPGPHNQWHVAVMVISSQWFIDQLAAAWNRGADDCRNDGHEGLISNPYKYEGGEQ